MEHLTNRTFVLCMYMNDPVMQYDDERLETEGC